MYSVNVRAHFMIAHSFRGEIFGPARRLHGATYVVDATFRRRELDELGLVVDIGAATDVLNDVLHALNYRNLDDEPAFAGRNTTTEFLAGEIHRRISHAVLDGKLGETAQALDELAITLHESHVAWARYEGKPRREAS